jgi:hypothetical protein
MWPNVPNVVKKSIKTHQIHEPKNVILHLTDFLNFVATF